jgi:hypothetical protein
MRWELDAQDADDADRIQNVEQRSVATHAIAISQTGDANGFDKEKR